MRERLKLAALALPGVGEGWAAYRSVQLHHDYARRSEHYHRLAAERGLSYSEPAVAAQLRERLARRGWTPARRNSGEVHTFAFIPRLGWHSALYPDLAELGPVTEFDYAALGYTPGEFMRGDRAACARRREMNRLALEALRAAHARRPVDWVFIYASGLEVRAELVRAIVEELGIPVVNMCLDDKQSWTGPAIDGQRTGQVDIAAAFDLCWTSARVACDWYLVEGARPLYLPEGFTASIYHPLPVERDLPVSFVGAAYGFRPRTLAQLRARGVEVHPFGPGWGTRSVWGAEQVEVFNRSAINLGMGGIGYSPMLTNVKTRDFEITGTGGGVYLTSFNPDLAQHYAVGREVLCYRSDEEMVELIRHYLAHPDEARQIARRGRERSLAEHRWLHRYQAVCRTLGILGEAESRPPGASPQRKEGWMDQHRTGPFDQIRRRDPVRGAPAASDTPAPLFDRIRWRDPVSGAPLEPIVSARTPAGVPVCGALRVAGTQLGYPITDCVARLTPALAEQHRAWLVPFGLEPVPQPRSGAGFQPESTVESFGFQWNWHSEMRSEADLEWRVARRFQVEPEVFRGRLALDAGAGAGDQSRWIIGRGAEVVSVDLSSAIDVVARKLRMHPGWVGVQGDVTALPLQPGQFDVVYCEGVIQHTRDSAMAVRELARVLAPGGLLLATHYDRSRRLLGRLKLRYIEALRARWSRSDQHALLLKTGRMAALAQLPLLGRALRLSGTVMVDARMPDFKTTWVNTYDAYGPHAFQRYVAPEAFWAYFDRVEGMEIQFRDGGVVAVRKQLQPVAALPRAELMAAGAQAS